MTTLTKTPAHLLQVNDRVCGDWGRTFTVTDKQCVGVNHVTVRWDNGYYADLCNDEVFYVETAKQEG